jgi:hypothetical protein
MNQVFPGLAVAWAEAKWNSVKLGGNVGRNIIALVNGREQIVDENRLAQCPKCGGFVPLGSTTCEACNTDLLALARASYVPASVGCYKDPC